jgi:hypothetical protein
VRGPSRRHLFTRGDRAGTAIILVGLWSATQLLFGVYGITIRTIEALHAPAGWHDPIALGFGLPGFLLWVYSAGLLVPAGVLGAVDLLSGGRPQRARAGLVAALMCVGVVGQFWTNSRANQLVEARTGNSSWLRDGRLGFALMCLLAIVVFGATALLLKPRRETTARSDLSTV